MTASETGRDHIPPRVFKEMTRLNKQREKLDKMLSQVGMFNAKSKAEEISKFLEKYIPSVEKMSTQLRQYRTTFENFREDYGALVRENETLLEELNESRQQSVLKRMVDLQLQRDYEKAVATLERIPPEILEVYAGRQHRHRERSQRRNRDALE